MKRKNDNLLVSLILGAACIFFIGCLISSCGKGKTILPVTSNTLYQVINLSPDLLPVDLYIATIKRNSTSFLYPNPSGYFSLASVDTPFQIRASSTIVSTTNILSIDTVLKSNVKYTLFITGLRATNSISYILTRDTSATKTYKFEGKELRMIEDGQQQPLMLIYGAGFVAIYLLFFLMYKHAEKLAAKLELTPAELYATKTVSYINLICVGICLLAMSAAVVLKEDPGTSGFIYFLFPFAYSFWFGYRGKKGRKLFPKSA